MKTASKNPMIKKSWKNPHIITVTSEELANFIKVATRSTTSEGVCIMGVLR